MKYTRKLPPKIGLAQSAAQLVLFIPLFYGITNQNMMLQIIFWPLLIISVIFSIVHRVVSYCQPTDEGVYVAPAKILIPYSDIISVAREDRSGAVVEYANDGEVRRLVVYLTMPESFVNDLQARMQK